MERREFLALTGTPACLNVASRLAAQIAPEKPKAGLTVRISSVEITLITDEA